MSKRVVFELNVTLKAGSKVYLKGTTFTEDDLPEELKPDIDNETGTIKILTYGEDIEGSSFDPETTVIKKKLKTKKRKL